MCPLARSPPSLPLGSSLSPTHARQHRRLGLAASKRAPMVPEDPKPRHAAIRRHPLDRPRRHSPARLQTLHKRMPFEKLLVAAQVQDIVVSVELGSLASALASTAGAALEPSSVGSPPSSPTDSATRSVSESVSVSASASTSASGSASGSFSASVSASASGSTSVSASQSVSSTSRSQSESSSAAPSNSSSSTPSNSSATPSNSFSARPTQSSAQPSSSHSTSAPESRSPSPSSSIPRSSSQSTLPSSSPQISSNMSSAIFTPTRPPTLPLSTSSDLLPASSSLKGSLSTGTSNGVAFAHNIGGIIGVSLASLAAVLIGVFIVFFACRRYRQRKAQTPPEPAGPSWRAPLDDGESVASVYPETSVGHASGSLARTSSGGHTNLAFAQAGATLAGAEPGMWYAAGALPPQEGGYPTSPSSQGHSSSQSHSNGSHRPLVPATASSELAHSTEGSSPGLSSSLSPPSSYGPGKPMASSSSSLLHRLRGRTGTPETPPVPPSPRFVPPASYDPSAPPPPPPKRSSLLNPPIPVVDLTPASGPAPRNMANWPYAAWNPHASRPIPSPALTDDSEIVQPRLLGLATEGLLRPLMAPTYSTRTLGDDIDYSRPLARRMATEATLASNASMEEHIGHGAEEEAIGYAR